jgi:hypothetical protein
MSPWALRHSTGAAPRAAAAKAAPARTITVVAASIPSAAVRNATDAAPATLRTNRPAARAAPSTAADTPATSTRGSASKSRATAACPFTSSTTSVMAASVAAASGVP